MKEIDNLDLVQLEEDISSCPDTGPWEVQFDFSTNKAILFSSSFENDVMLTVNGDFASLEDKFLYVNKLRDWMNASNPSSILPIIKEVRKV